MSQVPCATTMCVVNIQPHEAKVEAVMDSFVSLREEAAPSGIGADLQKFLDDDDDAYMVLDPLHFITYHQQQTWVAPYRCCHNAFYRVLLLARNTSAAEQHVPVQDQ